MDPQLTPPVQQNPYDFLNVQPGGQKKSLFGGQKQKMLLFALFVTVVLIAVVIAIVVFRSLTAKDYSSYKSLLNKQTEIIRITEQGSNKARDSAVKNYATTLHAVTQSEKNATLDFVSKAGIKIDDKQLEASADSNNDKILDSAEASNQYDQTLMQMMNKLVQDYQKEIKVAAAGVTTKSEKAVVIALQNNAKTLNNTPTQQ